MLKAQYFTYTLDFKFLAGTSRGTLKQKKSWFIKIWDQSNPKCFGLGEAGALPGLSVDYDEIGLEKALQHIVNNSSGLSLDVSAADFLYGIGVSANKFPSLVMALETALRDLANGGRREIYKNRFYQGKKSIPINGLIWMGDKSFMVQQIDQKLNMGFDCIKIKVGALDFETELEVLDYLRSQSKSIEIRLDANGAFNQEDVFDKLNQLSGYNIHSIEQPVKQGNAELMKKVIDSSPIKVALDEELIGINEYNNKLQLLEELNPDYIILKPSLLGGFDFYSKMD